MRLLLIFFSFLFFCSLVQAHSVEQYVASKNGVTLFAIIGYSSVEERKFQDAFLDRLTEKLKRRKKDVEIFLLIDQFNLFPNGRADWFATIAYDRLRRPDPEFLTNYFFFRMGKRYRQYLIEDSPPSNKHQNDLPETIDIGSTYNKGAAPMGLKIMYNYAHSDSATYWDRLYTLVQYSIDNLEAIRQEQKRITLLYPVYHLDDNDYKSNISLLTVDTKKIRSIPLLRLGFDHKNIGENNNARFYIISGLGIMVLLILGYIIKKRKLLT